MKISTKGRYALRMLLDLAEHQSEGYIALKDIAARQDVSKKYLEQIIPILNKSGFLLASRGFQGGYRLAKTPDKYTVGDILRATEATGLPVRRKNTPLAASCALRKATSPRLPVWTMSRYSVREPTCARHFPYGKD